MRLDFFIFLNNPIKFENMQKMGKHILMGDNDFKDCICGIWADSGGLVHVCHAESGGGRRCSSAEFHPFLWTSRAAECSFARVFGQNPPAGGEPKTPLDAVMRFSSSADMEKYFKNRDKRLPVERISSVENQYLLANSLRMFSGMKFEDIGRLQLDIEVHSDEGFPQAGRPNDRIIAVGLSGRGGKKILEISEMSDAAEKKLLTDLQREILTRDPDLIEGHNIFKFDLPYISERSKRLGAPMQWGRFGAAVQFRKSRLKIAERTFAYTRCDIPGRTVVDTLILVQLYDISAREMASYSLKESAVHFGISSRENRTYIAGGDIKDVFNSDRKRFRAYLSDDLRETAALADNLLPTYVAQVQNFPLTLQECILRGSGMKVESLFLEKYFGARAALPLPQETEFFEGALSASYEEGVFKNVLHYDVASLYPSLMLVIGKCPRNDYLQVFLRELRQLREYRLHYKNLAKIAVDETERREYDARQKSFKILINSFYGYLGLATAVFGDTSLADEITARGRDLLVKLMDAFVSEGCSILEADTDGIYLTSPDYYDKPEAFLEKVMHVLPDGVDLDYDGKYPAMFCYKAKNYALLQSDGEVVLRGSSFRNRAAEPFLRSLTRMFVEDKLRGEDRCIYDQIDDLRAEISSGKMDVRELAKSEYISKSPSQYESEIASSGKGRRAAMEAALMMSPRPEAGEKVSYYICSVQDSKKLPDWKKARPVELYDSLSAPYDPSYYLKKIDDWRERFLPPPELPVQTELF